MTDSLNDLIIVDSFSIDGCPSPPAAEATSTDRLRHSHPGLSEEEDGAPRSSPRVHSRCPPIRTPSPTPVVPQPLPCPLQHVHPQVCYVSTTSSPQQLQQQQQQQQQQNGLYLTSAPMGFGDGYQLQAVIDHYEDLLSRARTEENRQHRIITALRHRLDERVRTIEYLALRRVDSEPASCCHCSSSTDPRRTGHPRNPSTFLSPFYPIHVPERPPRLPNPQNKR